MSLDAGLSSLFLLAAMCGCHLSVAGRQWYGLWGSRTRKVTLHGQLAGDICSPRRNGLRGGTLLVQASMRQERGLCG
ncbi:hypothetical protein BD779DRAFT_1531301, partial [Infundibulicybe gibba]